MDIQNEILTLFIHYMQYYVINCTRSILPLLCYECRSIFDRNQLFILFCLKIEKKEMEKKYVMFMFLNNNLMMLGLILISCEASYLNIFQ